MTFQRHQLKPEKAEPDRSARILLIDDNALTRSVLRNILREGGYQMVREASEAEAGLALMRHFLPDVICLDVNMPGKSGIELLRELKTEKPQTPVLMITASSQPETVEACARAGADGYLIKPFSTETLVKTIEAALAKAARRH